MNGLLWIAQFVLACVFAFTGFTKLFAYERLVRTLQGRAPNGGIGISRAQAAVIGLLELAAAIGVLTPNSLVPLPLPAHLFIRLASAGLALLMVGAGIYHLRRQESAAPAVSLFLLAVFVFLERWPR